ncbi:MULTISPECIES: SDR family NAD(P)-dependent oxidoreductase [unclassified Novosphingobium]|uniref:SDR family NAD(P)-dependent oxidoreductase n=1 Tax=unclassified Novosphingobium TaxID=2644732 RepID=UPI00086B9C67|nr:MULTISPECIES: SDR family NAD(P)-dependent oxidoreductase [unclassified Novosphingobium]MBN9143299.1 SDR family oxidoreductase [Novosphingobium sp.]MDR6706388.1 NAD(P)-dependent dehydrogenase (short-subunit alcohol dehydrogenase family) [Novosphingobium sp. 1748]ODU82623.1 MAG: 3-oxoacyl-ACP reductase [Novosphingobium sp. SCN 63-17]OJX89607.1 MAG: 3-oxoacyl-ACP reductase [Novosphingobium sp. 63-713]
MSLPQTPSFRLDGRRALVTGAGRGIGLAAAAALAQAGAQVTLAARTRDEIEAGAAAIREAGGLAEAAALDVSDLRAVEAFFAARPAFHVLVNNAGTNRPKAVWEVTPEDYDAVLDLNVKSAFFVAQHAVKAMLRDGMAGSLIHMGSQMGHVGGPRRSLYCASKWAIEGMNKAFALDLAPHGIRSNTIAPTFIETPMTRPFFEDQAFLDSVLAKIKLGRLGQVEDLMGPVLFLASDASALITGTSLIVDGGWTAD